MMKGKGMGAKTILRRLAEFPDDELLARLVWGEARGESIEGKLAVAHVVMNRVASGKYGGKGGVKGVALKPWQFSCFNASDTNLALLVGPSGGRDAPLFRECLAVAQLTVEGLTIDPTGAREEEGGATHYFNPRAVAGGWPASWDPKRMRFLRKIGRHDFYKEF